MMTDLARPNVLGCSAAVAGDRNQPGSNAPRPTPPTRSNSRRVISHPSEKTVAGVMAGVSRGTRTQPAGCQRLPHDTGHMFVLTRKKLLQCRMHTPQTQTARSACIDTLRYFRL